MKAPWNRQETWFSAARHGGDTIDTGGSRGTSSSETEPWKEQKPYLMEGFQRARSDVLNRPLQYYGGSTVIDFSPETEASLGARNTRALAGSQLVGDAKQYSGDVLAGKFTSPETNPFFRGVQDSVMSMVQPQAAGQFARAGRTGGSALANQSFAKGVTQAMQPALFGAYQQERGMQENAANRAINLGREDYFDIDQLASVGAAREGKSGERLAEQIARHNFTQAEPTNRLAQFMQLIQGNYGSTSTGSNSATNEANTAMLLGGTGMKLAGGGK